MILSSLYKYHAPQTYWWIDLFCNEFAFWWNNHEANIHSIALHYSSEYSLASKTVKCTQSTKSFHSSLKFSYLFFSINFLTNPNWRSLLLFPTPIQVDKSNTLFLWNDVFRFLFLVLSVLFINFPLTSIHISEPSFIWVLKVLMLQWIPSQLSTSIESWNISWLTQTAKSCKGSEVRNSNLL
jgi:hypothetical protein